MRTCAASIPSLVDATTCDYYHLDDDATSLWSLSFGVDGVPEPNPLRATVGEGPVGRCASSGQPVTMLHDDHDEATYGAPVLPHRTEMRSPNRGEGEDADEHSAGSNEHDIYGDGAAQGGGGAGAGAGNPSHLQSAFNHAAAANHLHIGGGGHDGGHGHTHEPDGARSVVCVPVTQQSGAESHLVGVLCLRGKQQPMPTEASVGQGVDMSARGPVGFSQDDVLVLSLLAQHVSATVTIVDHFESAAKLSDNMVTEFEQLEEDVAETKRAKVEATQLLNWTTRLHAAQEEALMLRSPQELEEWVRTRLCDAFNLHAVRLELTYEPPTMHSETVVPGAAHTINLGPGRHGLGVSVGELVVHFPCYFASLP